MARPIPLHVQPQNIPDEMKRLPRWVAWQYVQNNKADETEHWTKHPVNARTGGKAMSNNPATWCDYDTASDALLTYPAIAGIGFMLGDGWIGIDVDDCYDMLDGFSPLAEQILNAVQGYAEISPSGKGVKVLTRGTIPQSKADHKKGLEIYDSVRFFTVTGHAVPSRINNIPEQPQNLASLYVRHFGAYASSAVNSGGDALVNAKGPLAGWDLERVELDVLPHLPADCHYSEWIEVGAALHHQGEGDDAWLDAWDDWSATAPDRYTEDATAAKWETFSEQRAQGKGPVTLATLIQRAKRNAASEKYDRADHWKAQIAATADRLQLMDEIPKLITRDMLVDSVIREELAQALQQRIKEALQTRHPIAAVRAWLTPVIEQASEGFDPPDWAKEHVYVTEDDAFFSLTSKTKLSTKSFNALYNRNMPKDDFDRPIMSAADAALEKWGTRVVTRIGYHPLFQELFEANGDLYVNAYSPDQVTVEPPVLLDDEEAAIGLVKAHIANLLPDEREQQIFTSWLAFVVQNPGVKVRWAPYLCGPEGDGKSFFGALLGLAMGSRNVRVLNGSVLESSQFTGWAIGQCATVIEEMKLHGHNRFDATNTLKPYLTNDMVPVHPKGKDPYTALNTTQYLILSNYMDGVPVTDSDRRFCFMRTRFSVASLVLFKAANADYYTNLFEAAQTYPGAMRYWLMHFTDFHPDFDPNRNAPITAMRSLVIDMAQSDIDVACQDVLREGGPGVTASWVASASFTDLVMTKLGPNSSMSRQQAARIGSTFLSSSGFVYMGNERHRVGPNAVQSRIWCHESIAAVSEDWWTVAEPVIAESYSVAAAEGFLD